MRKLIKDLSPGQIYGLRVRAHGADASMMSEWSPLFRFTTVGDQIAPKPITALSWASKGSSFVANWTAPTQSVDNTLLKDFRNYRITISQGLTNRVYFTTNESFEFTQQMNADLFGDPLAFTVTIDVRAVDQSGNMSTAVVATATEDTPPVPSTPITSIVNGQITVTWDGNPATGTRNALSVNHVEVHISTTNNFTPSESTVKGRFNGLFPYTQSMTVASNNYGVVHYVKLVAVNRTGRKSSPSAQATATPTRISGLDIADGQIGTQQINFTAKDIGGANAYYPATVSARDALTGVKNGDIAYVTGSGYAPYRYNGSSWVSAPEVGVISGTKILTGTLTSDAVGTNLLITAAANIGTAVIDYTKIGSVDAGVITVGTLKSSSTVTYGGGPARPTWSFSTSGDGELNNINVRGQLIVGNSGDTTAVRAASIVRSFDYIANTAGWAIKGDGTVEFNNGVFRGSITGSTIIGSTYRTATTGRRIEIEASGNTGEIKFLSPTDVLGRVRGFTSTTGTPGQEAIQLALPVTSTHSSWNAAQIEADEQMYLSSSFVGVRVGGNSTTVPAKGLSLDWSTDRGVLNGAAPTNVRRVFIGLNAFYVYDQAANLRLYIHDSDTRIYDPNDELRFWISSVVSTIKSPDGASEHALFNDQHVLYVGSDVTEGSVQFRRHNASTVSALRSPILKFLSSRSTPTSGQYAQHIKYVIDHQGGGVYSNGRIQITDIDDNALAPLQASNLALSSSITVKDNVADLGGGYLDKVNRTRVVDYTRKNEAGMRSKLKPGIKKRTAEKDQSGPLYDEDDFEVERIGDGRRQVGLIVEEVAEVAPEIVVYGDSIDVYGQTSVLWKAVQELTEIVKAQAVEIKALQKGKK